MARTLRQCSVPGLRTRDWHVVGVRLGPPLQRGRSVVVGSEKRQ